MLYVDEKPKRQRRPYRSSRRANGPALRYYRERRGWTLHELQDVSGVSYTQISRLETGESRSPRKDTVRALADALGVDMNDLVIYDKPYGVPDDPGLTEENRERIEEIRQERRQVHEGDGENSHGAGDRAP
jgi:transcriptional regulator with XRE-family HTH domain